MRTPGPSGSQHHGRRSLAQVQASRPATPPTAAMTIRPIRLLDVVHEVESEGLRSSRIELGKNPRLTIGGNLGDLVESRLAQESHREVATFVDTAVFCGDRRLLDPFLQSLDGFVVMLLDLGPYPSK